ncbi:bis(5'-nucleosyl)-tetraphosphatase (symmetrical) YqeK [Paraclostridium sordellii]|uniref:HD domain-containing protein n=1 Tax=Paraclostridium sordellii TaxID=1505 RepID=UPI0005E5DFA3|nr:HD domain-containing protein [Paeniclostridium sordellii]CEP45980.1 HD superfamily hydrolase [[Clostridium] sordellii] [Paeniclostridium sordellii]
MINSINLKVPKITNDLKKSITEFLELNNCLDTISHSIEVANYAKDISCRYSIRSELAEVSGLLHDISAVIPNNKRIEVANILGIEIYDEERKMPLIIHQKISKVIAQDIFKINDTSILSAIECHTTLKKEPSKLDLLLFVSDKVKWDQDGNPPYLEGLLYNLDKSLEHSALYYIDYLLQNEIKVIHPWLKDAYEYLNYKLK